MGKEAIKNTHQMYVDQLRQKASDILDRGTIQNAEEARVISSALDPNNGIIGNWDAEIEVKARRILSDHRGDSEKDHVEAGTEMFSKMEKEIQELRGMGDAAATAVADYLADVGNSFMEDNPNATDQEVNDFMRGCLGDLVDHAVSLSTIECPPTRVVIDIDGGVATDRIASRPVELLIIDDDTEGVAPEDLNTIEGNEARISIFAQANGDIEAKQHIVDERDGCLRDIRTALKELPEKELLGIHTKWCRQTFTATSGNSMLPYSDGRGSSCCRGSLESSIAYVAEMKGLEYVRQLHAELGLSGNEDSMSPS